MKSTSSSYAQNMIGNMILASYFAKSYLVTSNEKISRDYSATTE